MINLKSFLKKHKLIIILGFVAIILGVLRTSFLSKEKLLPQTSPTPASTPTIKPTYKPLPSPIKTPLPVGRGDPELLKELLKETEQNFPLIDFLPYEDKNFSIDYIGPLKLKVLFKTPQASQSAVFDWIRSKDVDPSTHQIEFALF